MSNNPLVPKVNDVGGKLSYPPTTDWVSIPIREVDETIAHAAKEDWKAARETIRYDQFVQQLFKADTRAMMVLHAALGICGEAGELADALKKNAIYNKPIDRNNLVEELGDLEFYMQAVRNLYEISRGEVMQFNAEKLSKRYVGLKYTDQAAQARADKA
jgi:NTP pyrophosphatase (non-canonical NTP hydrolase)